MEKAKNRAVSSSDGSSIADEDVLTEDDDDTPGDIADNLWKVMDTAKWGEVKVAQRSDGRLWAQIKGRQVTVAERNGAWLALKSGEKSRAKYRAQPVTKPTRTTKEISKKNADFM